MQVQRTVTVEVDDEFTCSICCPYFRRYDSLHDGKTFCNLYNEVMLVVNRKPCRCGRCNDTHMFDMVSTPDKVEFIP